MKHRAIALVTVVSLALSGCETFSSVLPKKDPNPPKALQAIQPTAEVRTVWQVNTGHNNTKDYVRIHPLIDGQAIIVAGSGSVSAWDKSNGTLLWRTPISEDITGGVNGGEGLVFIGTSAGNAVALDRTTGAIRWVEQLDSEVLSVSPAERGRVAFRTGDGKLIGLASRTGERVWQQVRSTPVLSIRGVGTPVLAGEIIVVGFDNGTVTAFNFETGAGLWEAVLSVPRGSSDIERITDVDGQLKVVGTGLFASSYDGQIAGISLERGNVAWAQPFSSHLGVDANPEGLYATNRAGEVWKMNPQNGQPIWKTSDLERRQPTAPTLQANYVVVGDFEGYLHWINTQTGQMATRLQSDRAGYTTAPVVEGSIAYSFGRSGTLAAHRLNSVRTP